jgi:hypothetical protein
MRLVSLISLSMLFVSSGFAGDFVTNDMLNKMTTAAEKRVLEVCGSKDRSLVHDLNQSLLEVYSKVETDEGDAYEFTPKLIGAVVCKEKSLLIHWTVNAAPKDGQLAIEGINTSVTRIKK